MQFIGQYNIDGSVCDDLIALFKHARKEKLVHKGRIGTSEKGAVIDKAIKDSEDLYVGKVSDELLQQYRFPEFTELLKDNVDKYLAEHTILSRLGPFRIAESPIIQHYKPGGGFKKLHFERYGLSSSSRWLVWMMYLNTVKYGGGTYFKYQDFTATPEKGRMLLWPSDFTHTHKGVVAPSEHKYIFTGWLNFF